MNISDRNERIIAMRKSGKEPHQIAAELHMSRNAVCGVLHRAGVVDHSTNMSLFERRMSIYEEVEDLNRKIKERRERYAHT